MSMDDCHCQDLQRLATRLATGDLPADQRERLAGHLASCPRCRARVLSTDPLCASLLTPPAPPPPATLHTRIAAAAAPELAQRRQAGPGRRWWASLSPGLRLATAALWLLGLGLGWGLGRSALTPPSAAPAPRESSPTVSLLAGQTPGSLVTCYDNLLAPEGP